MGAMSIIIAATGNYAAFGGELLLIPLATLSIGEIGAGVLWSDVF